MPITSVNTTNIIAASQANTAVGTLLHGVYSGTVSDGVDSQALSNVIGLVSGLSASFDTGTLENIGNPITLTLTHDTVDWSDFTPSDWTASLCTITAGLADAWIFDDGVTLAASSGVGNTSYSNTTVSASANDVFNVEYYVGVGTSGKVRTTMRNTTTAATVTRFGTIGSNTYTSGSITAATGTPTMLETATGKDGVFKITKQFTALAAGTWRVEIGPEGTTGQTVKLYGVRLWINRSGSTVTHTVNIATPATANRRAGLIRSAFSKSNFKRSFRSLFSRH